MSRTPAQRPLVRRVLVVVLVCALLVLGGAIAIALPILTHSSAGGSGQERLPDGYVSEVRAHGADGRTRTVRVDSPAGTPADLARLEPGQELVIRGSGFDAAIGIYVAICAVPGAPGEKPSPCLGGVPDTEEGATVAESSVWITDDWAWSAFANHRYDNPAAGGFSARLLVPEPVSDGLDCRIARCAITTRADHTAANDRVQDIQLPVAFVGG